MSRTPAKFTQADVARVLRALKQTGVDMEAVLEPDGRIRIVQRQSDATNTEKRPVVYDGDIRL
jgi:hypothetical protein